MLNNLFDHSVAVKVLSGTTSVEYSERNVVLDIALALAEDQHRDPVLQTKTGVESARKRGRVGGRLASSMKTANQ